LFVWRFSGITFLDIPISWVWYINSSISTGEFEHKITQFEIYAQLPKKSKND